MRRWKEVLRFRKERRALVLGGPGEAADGEAPEEDAAQDGHEVADVHGHDCQHAAGLLIFCQDTQT